MPARVLLKNGEWVASSGEPYKSKPLRKRGDLLLHADKPDEPWRVLNAPELDGKIGYSPGNDCTGGWLTGIPPEIMANRILREMAEQNPDWIVLEYFEEPEWEPAPSRDEEGNPIIY